MQFKAICTDIDGTLLNSDRDLSPRLKAIVKNIPKSIPLILASSRMPDAMRHLQQDLGRLQEPLICYNGGFVLDGNGQILDSTEIPFSILQSIYALCKGEEIHLSVFQGEQWYEEKEDYWSLREVKNTKVNPTWMALENLLQDWRKAQSGAHKIMCMGESNLIHWLFGELHLRFGDQLHLYRSKDTYIEIAPRKISKASALKLLLERNYDFGLDQVIAFGDNYNDIDLIQSVGWGVAVANGRPELKAVCKELALHHKEDGVAAVLEKYFG
ncbi:Cof-type HAD-IIB family hydrolase [Algoriphagus sp.]|uniref:Cof-type HAD-IIB family hydrolase n=1 Tax=Algoriphagus sp. TaxID=1872435 RepID=UPI00262B6E0B|nr:Cof-type HAD-IIB family hydrolase [Algoriphagus sp.]